MQHPFLLLFKCGVSARMPIPFDPRVAEPQHASASSLLEFNPNRRRGLWRLNEKVWFCDCPLDVSSPLSRLVTRGTVISLSHHHCRGCGERQNAPDHWCARGDWRLLLWEVAETQSLTFLGFVPSHADLDRIADHLEGCENRTSNTSNCIWNNARFLVVPDRWCTSCSIIYDQWSAPDSATWRLVGAAANESPITSLIQLSATNATASWNTLDRNLTQYLRYERYQYPSEWATWLELSALWRFRNVKYEDLKAVLLYARRRGFSRYECTENLLAKEHPQCDCRFRLRFQQ